MERTFMLSTSTAPVRSLHPGQRRYLARAGGSLAVLVKSGDLLSLRNLEGGQVCKICFCDETGRFDTNSLGATADSDGEAVLATVGGSRQALATLLQYMPINFVHARMISLFGSEAAAGATAQLTASRNGLLIVAVPSYPMAPGNQNTSTNIELIVSGSALPIETAAGLPDPLREPVQDFRIKAATAAAYIVRAGEYIQVIDVSGRQCTDFQAMSLRSLDRGLDLALDATVTRTLLGRSYPTPGLPSLAYNRQFEPLVEIVQDTVGRHDAFATACSSRYYDDLGYPGHINCTDNFNRALAPYGVAPRKGWEALNYFYNTNIDEKNQLFLDEPWSRPGDYVLMRAVTDLLCVSSSCPDDIDAANGWDPTDIHIRTYSAQEKFTRAVAYSRDLDGTPAMTQETAFHHRFSELTSDMADSRGYWLPNRFRNNGALEEYWACRERAALIDMSPLRKLEITGPDAEQLLNYCVTGDMTRLSTGTVIYSAICSENGVLRDDGTIFRLGQNNFRWIGNSDDTGDWLREVATLKGFRAWVRSSSDQLHNLALQGPRSCGILRKIISTASTQPALRDLKRSQFSVARINDQDGAPVVVSRTGYCTALGYEIFCHPKDASVVFDAIWAVGEPMGLAPMGLEALDILRIEAGLLPFGSTRSTDLDPFETGIGHAVPLSSKAADFIGRDCLIERMQHPRYKFVGLDIHSNDHVRSGDDIFIKGSKAGIITASTRSPVLGTNIALARINTFDAAANNTVEIARGDARRGVLTATVVDARRPALRRPR